MDINSKKNEQDNIAVSDEAMEQFFDYLKKNEEYLDSGLGAFHTDNHSNW